MSQNRSRPYFASLSLTVIILLSVHFVKPTGIDAEEKPATALLASLPDVESANREVLRLGSSATPESWRHWQYGNDPSLAVEAVWRKSVPTSMKSSWEDNVIQPRQMGRFTGFMEGQLRVEVPEWWSDELELFNRGTHLPALKELNLGNQTIRIPKSLTPRILSERITVMVDGRGIDIPADVAKDFTECVSAAARGHRFVVAYWNEVPATFTLRCFDLGSWRQQWMADVWANSGVIPPFGSGAWQHSVELRYAPDGSVFVFGAGNLGSYCERFSPTGQRTLRFNSGLIVKRSWQRQ